MEAWMEIQVPIQLKEEISMGAYGPVYCVEYQGAQCMGQKLKYVLPKPGIEGHTVVRNKFLSEVSLMMKLRHPHIITIYGIYQSRSPSPLILSELMIQSLTEQIGATHPMCWTQHHPILLQVTSGLCYLHHHSPPLIHKNLNSANVLLDRGGVAKIAYLGVSGFFTESHEVLTSCLGNVRYLHHEVFHQYSHCSPKLDVFSLGVLFLESLTGNLPAPAPLHSDVSPDMYSYVDEVDRRHSDLSLILLHPYLRLIILCLAPETSRPSSLEVLRIMKSLKPPPAPLPLSSLPQQLKDDATVSTCRELDWYKQLDNEVNYHPSPLDPTPSPGMSVSNIATLNTSGMEKHCQLVSLGSSLYLYESDTGIFHGYFAHEGWQELSRCSLEQGSLCLLAGNPTVVGGWNSMENSNSNRILSFKRDKWVDVESWHEVLPQMPTARQLCSTLVHKSSLFVMGGVVGNDEGGLNTVEILTEDVWKSGPSLPSPICGGYACILADYLYIAGGYFGTFLSAESTLVLRARLSRLQLPEGVAAGEVCWEKHSYTPTVHCGLGTLGKSLVALGGMGNDGKKVKGAVRYDEGRREWIHLGNLLHSCCKVGLFVCEDGIKIAGHSVKNHEHFYIDNISLII